MSPVLTIGPFVSSLVALALVTLVGYAHYRLGDHVAMQLTGCAFGSAAMCAGDLAIELGEHAARGRPKRD